MSTQLAVGKRGDWWHLLIASIAIALAVLWVGENTYKQDLVVLSAAYALIGLGMYIPFILGGSISAAYSAYAAIGAYAVGMVASLTTWPLPMGWLLGALVSAAVAVVLGFATRRLSGFYLVAVTLLFSTAFQAWLIDARSITGGSSGIMGFRGLDLFGTAVSRHQQLVASAIVVCVAAFLLNRLRRSPWGIALQAKKEVSLAVDATGVPTQSLQLVSLGLGAAVASLGGGLFATYNGGINPETFSLHIVFLAVFMPLLGGTGSAWGAVVGALLIVELTVDFPALANSGTFILSIAVLIVLLIAPKGLLGYLEMLLQKFGGAGSSAVTPARRDGGGAK